MPIDPVLNTLLKKMWSIQESIDKGDTISNEDKLFYNSNLSTIRDYYKQQSWHWYYQEPQ